ncbi:Acetyltransferase (GNAT) family protein [Sulfitobacter sp. THAF37]|uniref:GNAT family N-acetyltransferase n=1 Tax=Sulfitobacter sp. THAF37 TaxID=2587855 RepID=UPI001267FD0B|nr:GNAT family N-acetyltransferase [Sulfitobacter sp. THAF37]QFT57866.1 Acetyltransferase (GNAT) family protein [Sulfitobacter sp. THAF37]
MADHIPMIETERLRLRAPKLDDLPALTAFFASARSHFVGGPREAYDARRGMMAVFGNWALCGFGMWYIADRDSDAFLGATGILNGPDWDEPELAWYVTEAAEGHGIAFEATQAARAHAAQHLGLDRIVSYPAPENTRSIALATRLGAVFEREGMLMGEAMHVYRHPKVAA